jgi:hypothetical protein
MSELKPCPFCGGRHIETAENLDLVYCFDCGAEMHTDLGGGWNTRPIEDALNKRIAELEAENEEMKKRVTELAWTDRPTVLFDLKARIAELEAAQRDLREYIEGLEAGIHDETVPEKFDENISALQKEFSMRFENESPVEFFRAIRAGQYPTPPEVQ